ncbi:hypothetical protein [Bacillus sp. AG4(2022)]|uniref:hypothetical protein n=1 Tax=Bacillus sp. AG4(2022) TaxID=2962594 RepID=UPI002880D065|nr:hypothetical protein [Bacillus sp. AG4(2022)]MDT0160285.1 hypothetical protein [Bacillus sp. AG4(2022)]
MDKLMCTGCGSDRNPRDFYKSFSPFHAATEKLNVCKHCLDNFMKKNERDPELFKKMMRMLDKPFLTHLFESAVKRKAYIGEYFQLINSKDFNTLTWDDSDFSSHKSTSEMNAEGAIDENDESEEIDPEIHMYWGRGYSDWEYSFLEEERHKLMTSFECPDYGMEMIMKDICFLNLDIEKVRQEKNANNQKIVTTLIETRSKLMNNANMNPIQSTGAEGNDQITFGTLIKKWENERPVPTPLEDEMKEYIDTYMIGHLAKMEGLSNELTEKYDKALSTYTIDFNEINKTDDEYED